MHRALPGRKFIAERRVKQLYCKACAAAYDMGVVLTSVVPPSRVTCRTVGPSFLWLKRRLVVDGWVASGGMLQQAGLR